MVLLKRLLPVRRQNSKQQARSRGFDAASNAGLNHVTYISNNEVAARKQELHASSLACMNHIYHDSMRVGVSDATLASGSFEGTEINMELK